MDAETLKIKLKNAQCAANVDFVGNSCYSIEVLEDMINNISSDNLGNKTVKIKFNDEMKDIKIKNVLDIENVKRMKKVNDLDYKKFLVDVIEQFMNEIKMEKKNGNGFKNMKKHYNWLLLPIFKDLRGKYSKDDFFRPRGPNTGHQWLSNFDIENVMHQYEKTYPEFKFLDAVPRDFDDFAQWNFSNKDYNNFTDNGIKKTKFGVIFNNDKSNQSGSHWTALYFDMNKKQIYFQDSVGNKPKEEFIRLMDSVEKQMGKGVDRRFSETRHQRENSECGVYSLSFILRLLNNESFDSIENNVLPDKDVNKCRSIYFNNNKD